MISKIYPPPRNRTVDLVKTVAICQVLLIHISAGSLSGQEPGSAPWLSALFWNALSRSAVPLFLMASGALLLPPERELTLKKLYTRNFPRLLIALLFWAAVYKLYALAARGGLSAAALVRAAKELLLFKHEEHLYYLHIMLLVYAFLPVTRLAAAHGDRRLLEYLLGLWFLLGILYPTVRNFWPVTLLTGIPVQWRMNMTYASIGYTLLGFYMAARPARTVLRPALLLSAGLGVSFFGTWALSAAEGGLNGLFLEGMSLGPFLASMGLFGLCQSAAARVGQRGGRLLAYASGASFCAFLSHMLFVKMFARLGLTAQSGPVFLTAPLLTLLVLACCLAAYAPLSRLPAARRWLV